MPNPWIHRYASESNSLGSFILERYYQSTSWRHWQSFLKKTDAWIFILDTIRWLTPTYDHEFTCMTRLFSQYACMDLFDTLFHLEGLTASQKLSLTVYATAEFHHFFKIKFYFHDLQYRKRNQLNVFRKTYERNPSWKHQLAVTSVTPKLIIKCHHQCRFYQSLTNKYSLTKTNDIHYSLSSISV